MWDKPDRDLHLLVLALLKKSDRPTSAQTETFFFPIDDEIEYLNVLEKSHKSLSSSINNYHKCMIMDRSGKVRVAFSSVI